MLNISDFLNIPHTIILPGILKGQRDGVIDGPGQTMSWSYDDRADTLAFVVFNCEAQEAERRAKVGDIGPDIVARIPTFLTIAVLSGIAITQAQSSADAGGFRPPLPQDEPEGFMGFRKSGA